jgi:hypothetical protein
MGGGAANLDIGSVGFENPGHRVLPAPVVIIVIAIVVIIPVTHPLVVVLTVSHVLPLLPAFGVSSLEATSLGVFAVVMVVRCGTRRAPNHRAVHVSIEFCLMSRSTRRVPNRRRMASRTTSFSPPKQAQVFSREFSSAISGFRSLCGHQQRSSLSHRAQLDLPFGTFHSGRALLNGENSGVHPQNLRGQQPWTDVVPGT